MMKCVIFFIDITVVGFLEKVNVELPMLFADEEKFCKYSRVAKNLACCVIQKIIHRGKIQIKVIFFFKMSTRSFPPPPRVPMKHSKIVMALYIVLPPST